MCFLYKIYVNYQIFPLWALIILITFFQDRPSIAIYQPKARLRLSEESDSNSASKDVARSQSTSDCEAVKKDEQPRHKKVQRYSERSKNRKSHKENNKEEEPKVSDNTTAAASAESCNTN